MIKEIIAMGKDVMEAKENAKVALGVGPLDDVNFEMFTEVDSADDNISDILYDENYNQIF